MGTPDQDTAAVVGPQRRMLELIYDTFAPIGEWPLFLYVSQLWSDLETDPREVYLDLAERRFVNPVMARTASAGATFIAVGEQPRVGNSVGNKATAGALIERTNHRGFYRRGLQ